MGKTIAIVGAGRVGRALGTRLRELGWSVGAVVTRSEGTARKAVRAIGGGQAHAGSTRQVVGADVILIATPDSAIERVAQSLAKIGGNEWRGRIVLHTSGALDRSALAALGKRGAAIGSIHPLQTFSGAAIPNLDGAVFGVEGDRKAQGMARRIARELGGVPVRLESRDKAAYHAAGAFASGLVLALVEAATRMLTARGFQRKRALQAVLGLTRQTLENLERTGARAAWTGPIARGDFSTVARHAAALRRLSAEHRAAYAAVSRLAAAVLARNPRQTRRQLDKVLRG